MHASNLFRFFSSMYWSNPEFVFRTGLLLFGKWISETPNIGFDRLFCTVLCWFSCVHVTEGSTSNTRRVREAGHASRRRERLQQLEEEGGVPPRRRRGRRADVEHQPEQENMVDDVDAQQMEEQELVEELERVDEEMQDADPRRRRKKKEKVVDPELLDDYLGGPYETGLLWKHHVHVARKVADGGVFINVKLTLLMLICVKIMLIFV